MNALEENQERVRRWLLLVDHVSTDLQEGVLEGIRSMANLNAKVVPAGSPEATHLARKKVMTANTNRLLLDKAASDRRAVREILADPHAPENIDLMKRALSSETGRKFLEAQQAAAVDAPICAGRPC